MLMYIELTISNLFWKSTNLISNPRNHLSWQKSRPTRNFAFVDSDDDDAWRSQEPVFSPARKPVSVRCVREERRRSRAADSWSEPLGPTTDQFLESFGKIRESSRCVTAEWKTWHRSEKKWHKLCDCLGGAWGKGLVKTSDARKPLNWRWQKLASQ